MDCSPLSMEFCMQEYCSGLPCPSPGDLLNPGIKHQYPALQVNSLPSEPPQSGSPGSNLGQAIKITHDPTTNSCFIEINMKGHSSFQHWLYKLHSSLSESTSMGGAQRDCPWECLILTVVWCVQFLHDNLGCFVFWSTMQLHHLIKILEVFLFLQV